MEENKDTTQDILNQVHESTPDSIHPLLDYLLENGKIITAGIVVIILIAAGFSGMKYMNQQKQLKAQSELGAILIKYSGAKQADALSTFAKTVPADMKPAVQLALAKAWMDSAEYGKAESVWADIATENAEMTPVAEMGKAKCKMLAGKPAEAAKILQNLINSAGPAYAASINRMLAEAAEKSGNTQMAIQAYQALMTSNPNERMYFESKIKELKAKL
ncbi:tetratricopeptide repeat protein [Maridesulfovibrio zosterae]|uniref:tetratricopeptide repeat protein n=1 Tax=Maridesulfovibrio zosterae TaxID=82171 RepID=UPI0004290D7D|nr:tetratricopeptide repeat protein [Maridesulfovibrio zosterae]